MIEVSYSGWVVLFCIMSLMQIGLLFWISHKGKKEKQEVLDAIKNHKDQMMIDNKSIAALIAKN